MSRIACPVVLAETEFGILPTEADMSIKRASEGNHGRAGNCPLLGTRTALRNRIGLPILAAVLLAGVSAQAQSTFKAQAVGTASAAQAVTVKATAAGAVATVKVLTLGAPGLDFAGISGESTCPTASFSASGGGSCTESVTFTPAYPGPRAGAVVLFDGSGDVLGMAYLSGAGTGGLGVLTPGNAVAVAGEYRNWTSTKNGVLATAANLDQPSTVAFDGAGNMYIADSSHNEIRKVTAPAPPAVAGIISVLAGTGDPAYTGDGGSAPLATLSNPSGVAVDGAGNVYIADTGNDAIRKIAAATGIITTVAGPGTPGTLGDGGPATAAYLNAPQGVTVDGQGNLFIADTNNQLVRRVDASTGIITTVAGNGDPSGKGDGKGTYSGDGKPAIDAGISLPYSVAFDTAGNMYIPDSANHRIRKVTAVNGAITSASIISTIAGTGAPGFSGDGGPATAAVLNTPSGVAVDPAGNLYIADTQNSRIRKVNLTSGDIATLTANGSTYINPGGSLESVQVYAPVGLFLDGAGNLYFADYFYMLVQKIESNTAILNFTKTPVQAGDKSLPQTQTVENDGNAALDLTAITPDANTAIDAGSTSCNLGGTLAVDEDCNVGVIFAPVLALVFPSGTTSEQVNANVEVSGNTVNFPANTLNFPLDIVAAGIATAVDSTTVNLISSLNPSSFGQSITFTATVTAGVGAGTPAGTVAFTNGATSLGAPVTLNANGVAALSSLALPVGANTITATYTPAANSVFLPSSTTLVQNVDELTATGLTSSVNPSALGASVTLTATVKVIGGGGLVPDGSVTFYDGATVLTNIPLTGATAVYSTSALAEGLHAISASYGGDAANGIAASTSPVVNQDVQATSATVVTSSLNPSTYGLSVTFTATVAAKGTIAPTGVVNFLDGGKQIGSTNLAGAAGQATFATSSLAVGSHTITVVYMGDSNNGGSTSAPITETVSQAQTLTTVNAVPSPGIAGAPVAITATVKVQVGSAATTGTVTFTNGTTTLGSASLGGGGTATINPMLAPGNYSIVATYGGDTNGSGSASTPLALTVNIATTSTTVSGTPNPALVQATVTFTATVTGNGGTPTGTVKFLSDGVSMGSAALNGKGVATFTYSALAAGTHSITASYAGDANDAASTSAAFSETVGTIATVTDLGASTTTGTSPQVILVATVVGASGPTPTGTVTFYNGATEVGASAVDSSGVATLVPNLPAGNYSLVAKYSGDALHTPSTSNAVTISSIPMGFNLAVTPPTVTMATTQNAIVSVALTSTNGFTDKIGLGCASLPAGVTCHFSTPAIVLPANGAEKVQLTIDTNNPLGGGSTAMNSHPGSRGLSTAGLFLPLSVLFGCIFWRFRRRYPVGLTSALLLLLSGAAMLVTGCSGISQGSAAPGTYVIQVTGVGTGSDITHYQNVTLAITK